MRSLDLAPHVAAITLLNGNAYIAFTPTLLSQLNAGLSTEYQSKPNANTAPDTVDADKALFAKYYVHQILQMDEDALRAAWNKVGFRMSPASNYDTAGNHRQPARPMAAASATCASSTSPGAYGL